MPRKHKVLKFRKKSVKFGNSSSSCHFDILNNPIGYEEVDCFFNLEDQTSSVHFSILTISNLTNFIIEYERN